MYFQEGFIDDLVAKVNIVEYIYKYVKIEQRGKYYWGLCPFHQEKSPSFMVDPFSGTYTCFTCGVTGNIITFVMKYKDLTFIKAVEDLANEFQMEVQLEDMQENLEYLQPYLDEKEALYQVNKAAADYFHLMLFGDEDNEGMQYFRDERKLSYETMENFYLGYMHSDANRLYSYLKKCGFPESIIFKSKLMGRNENGLLYSFFRNRVMIPIFDQNRKVVGFGGRIVNDKDSPKYLNSPETLVFDKRRNLFGFDKVLEEHPDNIIICEGYMDVIALHQAGFTNAVASLGTAFTAEQASIVKQYVENVYLSFDADDAGCNAASKSIAICKKANLNVKVINMDPYKDPDEFIKELGTEIYQERIRDAVSDRIFMLRYFERKVDLRNNQEISFKNFSRILAEFAAECSLKSEEEREKYEKFMAKYNKIVHSYFNFIKKH